MLDGPDSVDESVRRPVRLTPDGFAGVAYGWVVYPLLAGDVIDISGPSWEIEDCKRFLFAGSAIPYAPRHGALMTEPDFTGFDGKWNIDTNAFGHNVVFNAPEGVAVQLVDVLEKAGISVQRWDVSHRMAGDGEFYDWFARLRFKGTRDECVALVSAAFSPPAATGEVTQADLASDPALERLADLEAQVERLLDKNEQLRDKLIDTEWEAGQLGFKLQDAEAREAELTEALNRARQAENEELVELTLAENADLRKQLASLRKSSEYVNARVQVLEATVAELQDRLEELYEEERERRQAAASKVAPRVGVFGFLDVAFARLTLVLDSMEVLASMESPVAALRALTQIDMGTETGIDFEGAEGWREISKIPTGVPEGENGGRIYYKPDGDRILVSVHVNRDDEERRRHVERLRRL